MITTSDLPTVVPANGEDVAAPEETSTDSAAAEADGPGRLAELVMAAVLRDWKSHGVEVVAAIRKDRPLEFLKLVIGLFPKEAVAKEDRFDTLTDEQLAGQLTSVLARLAHAGIGPGEHA